MGITLEILELFHWRVRPTPFIYHNIVIYIDVPILTNGNIQLNPLISTFSNVWSITSTSRRETVGKLNNDVDAEELGNWIRNKSKYFERVGQGNVWMEE